MWDTVWQSLPDANGNFGFGDWALADPVAEPDNIGGLTATDPLTTAIILQLMTKARRPGGANTDPGSPGGWHGNYYDIDTSRGEGELGSLLWTLARGPIDYTVLQTAVHYAQASLQTLVNQGAVARFLISAEADMPDGWLKLNIQAFDPDGRSIFANSLPIA